MNLSKTTLKKLETAIRKEPLICGYNSSQIKKDFENLTKGQEVEVGYRTSCGVKDKTHRVFDEWVKIIKSLKKDGFIIQEKYVTHQNKSPTLANGFWNSIIYKITN
jgi:hypothetical protein